MYVSLQLHDLIIIDCIAELTPGFLVSSSVMLWGSEYIVEGLILSSVIIRLNRVLQMEKTFDFHMHRDTGVVAGGRIGCDSGLTGGQTSKVSESRFLNGRSRE